MVEKKENDEGDDIEYGMLEIGEGSGMQKMNPDALVPIPIKNVSCVDWVKVIYILVHLHRKGYSLSCYEQEI